MFVDFLGHYAISVVLGVILGVILGVVFTSLILFLSFMSQTKIQIKIGKEQYYISSKLIINTTILLIAFTLFMLMMKDQHSTLALAIETVILISLFISLGCYNYYNSLKILDTSINNIDEIATKQANTELLNLRISFIIKICLLFFILCVILLYGYHVWYIIQEVSHSSLLFKLLSINDPNKTQLNFQAIQEISKNSFWLDDQVLITFLIVSASAISAGLITIVLLINSINSKKKDHKDLLDILQKPLTSLTSAEAMKIIPSVQNLLKASDSIENLPK